MWRDISSALRSLAGLLRGSLRRSSKATIEWTPTPGLDLDLLTAMAEETACCLLIVSELAPSLGLGAPGPRCPRAGAQLPVHPLGAPFQSMCNIVFFESTNSVVTIVT